MPHAINKIRPTIHRMRLRAPASCRTTEKPQPLSQSTFTRHTLIVYVTPACWSSEMVDMIFCSMPGKIHVACWCRSLVVAHVATSPFTSHILKKSKKNPCYWCLVGATPYTFSNPASASSSNEPNTVRIWFRPTCRVRNCCRCTHKRRKIALKTVIPMPHSAAWRTDTRAFCSASWYFTSCGSRSSLLLSPSLFICTPDDQRRAARVPQPAVVVSILGFFFPRVFIKNFNRPRTPSHHQE